MERDLPKGSAPPPRKADDDSCRLLLDQIAQGSESALAEFYRLFEARIYAFAQIRLNDFHEAADLLNEVMWEIWRGAGRCWVAVRHHISTFVRSNCFRLQL